MRESRLHLTRCCVEPGFQEAREEAAVVSAAVVMTCSPRADREAGGKRRGCGLMMKLQAFHPTSASW